MTEIHHSRLPELLRQPGEKQPVWLIHGQEMLVEQCGRQVSAFLLGRADRSLSYEEVDGVAENIPDLLEKLNTFSLLGGSKVVHFKDAGIFDAKARQAQLTTRIEQAWQNDQPQKAAKAFLSLCGRLGVDLGKPVKAGDIKDAGFEPVVEALGTETVNALMSYCRERGWSAGKGDAHVETLRQAVEKGFPSGHMLVVTVGSKVAKNLKFYKTMADQGVVVDCNVPQSERRADKQAREAVLRQTMEDLLKAAGKRMAPGLFDRLCQLTGFDLRMFTRNIEKLIDYSGPRSEIAAGDIQAVLQRTKQDPVYELTNALAERNQLQVLFYLDSLLAGGFHPLQLLAAMANQLRKLLVAKDFCESDLGRVWSAGMPYPQFQQAVIPAIQTFDDQVAAQASGWNPDQTVVKTKGAADLRLVANPGNAYPVYQTLLKSVHYSRAELEQGVQVLHRADVSMKTSAQDPVLTLKRVVSGICGN